MRVALYWSLANTDKNVFVASALLFRSYLEALPFKHSVESDDAFCQPLQQYITVTVISLVLSAERYSIRDLSK